MLTKKNILLVIFLLVLCFVNTYAQKLQTETTLQYDKAVGGVSIQRLQFDSPQISVKYDHKLDLAKKSKVNDVFGIFIPNTVKSGNFSLDLAVIKVGDWDVEDEGFIDLTATNKFKHFTATLEIGRGVNSKSGPRDYILGRLAHNFFTIEAGVMSDHGYSDIDGFISNKYYWGAIHPKYAFVAVGNEITRTWLLVGTKDLSSFGNLSCGDYDRKNGDFWFRTQFGFGNVNQKFFSLDNYIVSASYLILPPFFYKHFSPISTKGDYGLKFDGRRTGAVEKYELIGSRKFGEFGQLAIGWEKEVNSNSGLILEYYKDFSFNKFRATVEMKYESLYSRFSGFITTSYEL